MDVQLPDGTIVQGVPDGMTQSQLMAKLGRAAPAAPAPPKEAPSTGSTFVNGLVKGAAGFGDMIGSGAVNLANLGIAGYGTIKGLSGSTDLPSLIDPDALSGYKKIADATGLIRPDAEPTTLGGRVVDSIGQVVGGGGVNPRAIVSAGARGAIRPIVRDLAAAVAGGTGAALGQEATNGVNTGNDTLDRAIKIAGSLVGGMTPAGVLSARGTAGDRVAAATKGLTADQIAQAQEIEAKARAAGTPVTGYEAIQAVTGTNPKMQTQQRVAEQSDHGAPLVKMAQDRPGNNAAHFATVADGVSPKEQFPDVLAGGLQSAADKSIQAARDAGNVKAGPYYAASSNDPSVRIPSHDWNTLTADPAIQWALQKVKADPLAGMQDATEGSVQWLDSAKKFLDDQRASNKQAGSNFAAKNAGNAATAITDTVDPLVPAYGKARAIIADNMKNVVEPMENSQVGKLAGSNDFKQQASNLLPENPLDVTPHVIDRTVKTVSGQDPDIIKRFIGQYLRGTFNESNGGGVTNNAMGGYNFAKKVADNPGQQDNLVQALMSSGADPKPLTDTLDVFRAQGNRPPVNSATTANASESQALGGKLADVLMRPLKSVGGAVDNWRNGLASKDLASALSDPESVQRLMEISRQNGTYSPMAQQLLAQIIAAKNSGTQTAAPPPGQ